MKYEQFPDNRGHFGPYGGRFVAETLMEPLRLLEQAYEQFKADPKFQQQLDYDLKHYVGRPSPLYFAERMTRAWGGARIWLKREDLNHTGAHKVNNTVGQALLAKHLGKTRIIAETGAGQHGVASATIAARLGLEHRLGDGDLLAAHPLGEDREQRAPQHGEGRARDGDGAGDAGDDGAGDARLGECLELLHAAAEDVGVAALEPHDDLALLGAVDEELVDPLLRDGVVVGLLADVDHLDVGGELGQDGLRREPVEHDDVGRG